MILIVMNNTVVMKIVTSMSAPASERCLIIILNRYHALRHVRQRQKLSILLGLSITFSPAIWSSVWRLSLRLMSSASILWSFSLWSPVSPTFFCFFSWTSAWPIYLWLLCVISRFMSFYSGHSWIFTFSYSTTSVSVNISS